LRDLESLLNSIVRASMKMDRVGRVESMSIKPEKFGRYVLLDRIGAGGMAEVFRAVMPGVEGFQRTFVVKRILAERATSPYFVDMFVQEARINALLHHPNIVQVFDFGNVGGTYFLAMEYVRGRDVSEILRRLRSRDRPCPVGVAVFIAREVAAALAYAHALSGADGTPLHLVHRDVSPSNIICLRAGGVKLLDFGIAKALGEPEVEKTGHGLFKGKLSYLAPERVKDQPIDGRSDLFSLGVVLWELLSGQRLFRGKSDLQTLKNVVELEVAAPSTFRPDVSPELDAVVMRALARDPEARCPTGKELVEELDRLLGALHYQPRALPDLLQEVFGSELTSQELPNTTLTAALLAACAAEGSSVVSAGGPTYPAGRQLSPDVDEYSISIGTAAPVRAKPGWMSWAAATIGTVALILLAFARGGGGRSQAASPPYAAAPAPAPTIAPAAAPPVAAPASDPATSPGAAPAAAASDDGPDGVPKPPHHGHYSGKGRVTRGLSVDPFAEAASRGGR
jgi:serine/threonine protein kinase